MSNSRRRTMPPELEAVFSDALAVLKPPPRQTVSEWAAENRFLTTETSAIAGLWRNNITPYLVEIMDAFTDPKCQHIVFVSSSQVGKTEFELNCIGYIIDNDPAPIMFIMPTIDDVKKTSRLRLAPMIRACPSLTDKVVRYKSRDSGNTILEKSFVGGFIKMAGSNAAAALASTPARYIFGDERDRWAISAGTEGDPWGLLKARVVTFYRSKMVEVSTPTVKGASPIAASYELGTMEHYCVECTDCGEYVNIVFNDIRFETENGRLKGEVLWRCPRCGCCHNEQEIKSQPFKWIAATDAPKEAGCRSFWLNAFVSPWMSWEKIVCEFLNAGKNPNKLQTVFNTLLGELWENRGDIPDEGKLLARREHYDAELPEGVLALTMGVDTQGDRLEYEVVGWGHNWESWGIKRGVIVGDPADSFVWERLEELADHIYRFRDGRGLKIMTTFVDSGGNKTMYVYQFCKAHSHKRIYAIKGRGGDGIVYVSPKASVAKIVVDKRKIGYCKLYTLGVDAGKAAIMSALEVQDPGMKYCHFPDNEECGYNDAYFYGLLSEHLVLKEHSGGRKYVWEIIPGHKRNEPLDCRNYALAAITLCQPNFDELDAKLRAEQSVAKGAAASAEVHKPTKHRIHRQGDNGYADAW